MNYEGKYILVIGATAGMGRATAEHLHELGAHVILVARNEDKLRKLRDEMGDRVDFFPFDMNAYDRAEEIFLFCKDRGYKLDGLFYSVGVCEMTPVRNIDIDRALSIIGLNSVAFLTLGRYFSLRKYSNEESAMVAISSFESALCDKGQSIYAGSKAQLEAFVRVMAKEFAARRIRVNAILPAIVDTEMLHRNQEAGNYSYEEIETIQSFGVIDPKQVAYLAAFLMSEQAKFITGESIRMSANWLGER